MTRKMGPRTAPASNYTEALANVQLHMQTKSTGWDRVVVRDIINVVYGDTDQFVAAHLGTLERKAQTEKAKKLPAGAESF